MPETTQFLTQVFGGLDGSDLQILRQAVARRHVAAGTRICQEDEIGDEFFIVVEGKVGITKRLEDDGERLLALKETGQFFGEMGLVDHRPRAATATALSETDLLVLSEETFTKVLARNPIVALAILRQVSQSLRETDQQAIRDLERANRELRRAYRELEGAQEELVQKRALERDLEIAAEVQRQILPAQFPQIPGFSFAARTLPARVVGGDFYDVRLVADNKLALLMADVAGKSIHAAIFMAVTRGLFLTEARHTESPRELVCQVHELLMEITQVEGLFVTAFYAVIDTRSGRMRYARAGHVPPLHYRKGAVRDLQGKGRFLGMFAGLSLEERRLQLLPGDLLVLFSDGVTDAINGSGEPFGLERLRELVRQHAPLGAQGLCDVILDKVLAFQGETAQFDDITLQVVAYDGN